MHFVTGTSPLSSSDPVNKRLIGAVLFSVFLHALLLSLQFGLPGLGLPGLELPWNKRRADIAPLEIQLANVEQTPPGMLADAVPATAPSPKAEVPVAPALTASSPVPAVSENPGITLLAAIPDGAPVALKDKSARAPISKTKNKKKKIVMPPFAIASRPPPVKPEQIETPVRIIAQDKNSDNQFVVPLPNPEEPEHQAVEIKELIQQSAPVSVESVDQTEALAAELAAAKEKQAMITQQALAAQLMRETQARTLAASAALAERQAKQLAQQQQAAKRAEEDSREQAQKQVQKQAEDSARRQAAALALQKQLIDQEQIKRVQQQEQTLLETARLEELKRQEQQRLQRQRAIELETRQQAEQQALEQQQQLKLQATLRQKQADELAEKQKTEAWIARQKEQELSARKAAETKLAEQKIAEQKIAEQRAAEQRIAEQKMAEQRAEQAAAQQSVRERALSTSLAAQNSTSMANSAQAAAGTEATALPNNIFSSDLANRAREQAKGLDFLRGTPPVSRQVETAERSRRRSILGSIDREVPLRMYVDSWRQKIERNGYLNYSQMAKDKARGDPVVVVALRSDGTVEEITIIRSSGRADLDEAVRRIIRVNAPYAVFPPNIAAKYDVIEIRRVWNFDETLKILEEIR
ncbi:MAG: energy transducer TonB [Undibacterium sp.]|uniref:energy transducer TonB n=1 Tax=Undibacterium sp. TaxID=1914977 RepID=UPI00271FC42E|nr:energy transducer TonB [Undibacterium sp.]MDO8650984.1 energy transducer TonB [Undibacterium sp.]